MKAPKLSNRLTDLADRVKEANRQSDAAIRLGAEKALEAGGLLVEAKAAMKHGEWLPFLERAELPVRHAQRLTRLWRSGLECDSVSYLGGITPALAFLSRWRLPAFEELLMISDPERDRAAESFGRGAAFIWRDEKHPDHFHVGIINGGEDERCIHTKRPMLPTVECEGYNRPVNTITLFLTTNFALPIDQWEIRSTDREPRMSLVLAPFWNDDTLREGAAV